jgi:hypothetical protein
MRNNSELNFVTSNHLNFVLDVTPECALNGGRDQLCVSHRLPRGLVRMRASSSDSGESSQNHGVVCGQQVLEVVLPAVF